MLEIHIPKPEQKKPRTVQINLGTNPDINTIESADHQANSREPDPGRIDTRDPDPERPPPDPNPFVLDPS